MNKLAIGVDRTGVLPFRVAHGTVFSTITFTGLRLARWGDSIPRLGLGDRDGRVWPMAALDVRVREQYVHDRRETVADMEMQIDPEFQVEAQMDLYWSLDGVQWSFLCHVTEPDLDRALHHVTREGVDSGL